MTTSSTAIKDSLFDIVRIVNTLPFDVVKVSTIEGKVKVESRLEDTSNGSVIFFGKVTKKVPELNGVFGLSNIPMLVGLTNVDAFKQPDATITLKKQKKEDIEIPEEINFERAGSAKASYRLTSEKAIPQQMKMVNEIEWDVTVEQPSKKKIGEFAQMAGIYSSQEAKFSVKVENKQMKFLIGDENAATHRSNIVFAEDVVGTYASNFYWSIGGILKVLNLGASIGNTKLSITKKGILQIEIDTGIGQYTFLFPGSN